jgi:hypothetical protein
MAWNPEDPVEKQKRISWSVATSAALVTGEDPLDIYNRLMDSNNKPEVGSRNITKTNESQISGNM